MTVIQSNSLIKIHLCLPDPFQTMAISIFCDKDKAITSANECMQAAEQFKLTWKGAKAFDRPNSFPGCFADGLSDFVWLNTGQFPAETYEALQDDALYKISRALCHTFGHTHKSTGSNIDTYTLSVTLIHA